MADLIHLIIVCWPDYEDFNTNLWFCLSLSTRSLPCVFEGIWETWLFQDSANYLFLMFLMGLGVKNYCFERDLKARNSFFNLNFENRRILLETEDHCIFVR